MERQRVRIAADLPGYRKRNPAKFSPTKRRGVYERDDYRCQCCGWRPTRLWDLQIDHIVPRCFGGSNAMENLRTVCAPCNRALFQAELKRRREALR